MRLLLDTHLVLWWMTSDRRLTKAIREIVADPDNEIAVSAASLWEIAIKKSLGRITIDLHELRDAIAADGFVELPITFEHAVSVERLPLRHRDPFDRMLIAQAIAESRHLLTRDDTILGYVDVPGFAFVHA